MDAPITVEILAVMMTRIGDNLMLFMSNDSDNRRARLDTDDPIRNNPLCLFLNEEWTKELGLNAEINPTRPDADMGMSQLHETRMRHYRMAFDAVVAADRRLEILIGVVEWWGRAGHYYFSHGHIPDSIAAVLKEIDSSVIDLDVFDPEDP